MLVKKYNAQAESLTSSEVQSHASYSSHVNVEDTRFKGIQVQFIFTPCLRMFKIRSLLAITKAKPTVINQEHLSFYSISFGVKPIHGTMDVNRPLGLLKLILSKLVTIV